MARKFKFVNHFPCDDFNGYLHLDEGIKLMPSVSDLFYIDSSFIVGHYVGTSFRIDSIFQDYESARRFVIDNPSRGFVLFGFQLKHKRFI